MSTWLVFRTGIPEIEVEESRQLTQELVSEFDFTVDDEDRYGDTTENQFRLSVNTQNNINLTITHYDGSQQFDDYWGVRRRELGDSGLQIKYSTTHYFGGEMANSVMEIIQRVFEFLQENSHKEAICFVSSERE